MYSTTQSIMLPNARHHSLYPFLLEIEEWGMWKIRPAGDFPICLYCNKYCEIVDVVGVYKFGKTCGCDVELSSKNQSKNP
jgi:hypothetical protein